MDLASIRTKVKDSLGDQEDFEVFIQTIAQVTQVSIQFDIDIEQLQTYEIKVQKVLDSTETFTIAKIGQLKALSVTQLLAQFVKQYNVATSVTTLTIAGTEGFQSALSFLKDVMQPTVNIVDSNTKLQAESCQIKYRPHTFVTPTIEILNEGQLVHKYSKEMNIAFFQVNANNDITQSKSTMLQNLSKFVKNKISTVSIEQIQSTQSLGVPCIDLYSVFNESVINTNIGPMSPDTILRVPKPYSFKKYVEFCQNKTQELNFNTVIGYIKQQTNLFMQHDEGLWHRFAITPGAHTYTQKQRIIADMKQANLATTMQDPVNCQPRVTVTRDWRSMQYFNVFRVVCETPKQAVLVLQNLYFHTHTTLNLFQVKLYILVEPTVIPKQVQSLKPQDYEYKLSSINNFASTHISQLSYLYQDPLAWYRSSSPVLWHAGSLLRGQLLYGISNVDICNMPRFSLVNRTITYCGMQLYDYERNMLLDPYYIQGYQPTDWQLEKEGNDDFAAVVQAFYTHFPKDLSEQKQFVSHLLKGKKGNVQLSEQETTLLAVFDKANINFPKECNQINNDTCSVAPPPAMCDILEKLYPNCDSTCVSKQDIMYDYECKSLFTCLDQERFINVTDPFLKEVESQKQNIHTYWSMFVQGRIRLGLYDPASTYQVNFQYLQPLLCDVIKSSYEMQVERLFPSELHKMAVDYCTNLGYRKVAWGNDENIKPIKQQKTTKPQAQGNSFF